MGVILLSAVVGITLGCVLGVATLRNRARRGARVALVNAMGAVTLAFVTCLLVLMVSNARSFSRVVPLELASWC